MLDTTPFTPHPLDYLEAVRAFSEGAMPAAVYHKLCAEYAAVEDVNIERITYHSDGLNITGILATPASAPKGLIIYNRGGSGNYGMLTVHAVMRQFVPLARAGFLVAGSNYRGNDGSDGVDEFGGRDVDDVLALYHLLKKDELPTFVIGHSRGGMMTYLLLKRGIELRAAVVIAGVCDLRASANERPEMRERVYKRYIPNFKTNEDALLAERSAKCWPEAIDVPILLLHGTDDNRVRHTQSEAMAEALAGLGKPHTLVLYEGGNHALTRHWGDVLRETLNFFEPHV